MANCTGCTGTKVPGYGTTLEAQRPETQEWVLICGITNFNGPSGSRAEIDVTDLCSAAKEYLLDLPDFGTIDMTGFLMHGNEGQQLLTDLFNSAQKALYRLTLVDDGYGNGPVPLEFEAYVQSMPITVAPGAANQVNFTLRITGDVQTTLPTALGARLAFNPTVLNEAADNDGPVAGVVSVVLTGGAFAGTSGEALPGITFAGVPAGLAAHAQKISGSTAIINFSGAATAHAPGDSAQVGLTFADAAFTGIPAADIAGSAGRVITINFTE